MTKRDKNKDEAKIRELIEAEEIAALERFRSSHFPERLVIEIRSAAMLLSRPSPFRAIQRPIWISAAVAVLLGSAALLSLLRRPPAPNGSLIVENFLRKLPGIKAIENRPETLPAASPVTVSFLDKALAAFMANPQTSLSASPDPRHQRGFASIDPKAEPMDLRDIYDILIINKSVERVLTAIFERTKEG
jgi:hypothetical protein